MEMMDKEEKIASLRREFREMDLDNDGLLNITELIYHFDRKSV